MTALQRWLAEIDDRIWEAAVIQQTHASVIEEAYSYDELRSLVAAYVRIHNPDAARGQTRAPRSYELEMVERLKREG